MLSYRLVKMMLNRLMAITVTGLLSLCVVQCLSDYDVYYKWKRIEYDFPPNFQLNSSEYVPENNIISVLKIYENRMWITTPRYFRGVPVTLNTVPYNRRYQWWQQYLFVHNESPKLRPFPSYEMNKLGDCNALQLVSALDVDQFGRLWVVDVGRVNVLEPYKMTGSALNLCPAKLLIFDVKAGRSDLISTYTFPDTVAPNTTNILKEMQVACESEEDCWVFIPDFALNRLVVYDHKNKNSWTAQHPSMAPDPNKVVFLVNGVPFTFKVGISGVALTPRKYNFSDLYFSPLSSTTLYKIKTKLLMNPALRQNGTLKMDDVLELGEKPGQSDGIAMSSKGELFYPSLPDNSVISTKTSPEQTEINKQKTIAQSDVDLVFARSFAFDGNGKIAVLTNRFQLLDNTNPDEYNYRVLLLKHTGTVYAYNSC